MSDQTEKTGGAPSEEQVEDDLSYTRELRKTLLTELLSGDSAKKDPRIVATAAGVLNDMDRVSMTRKKMKHEEKISADANASQAAMVALMLKRIRPGQFHGQTSEEIVRKEIPSLSSKDVPDKLEPGATAIGTINGDFDSFKKAYREKEE